MTFKTLRTIAFYGMHLVYFPLLIVCLRLFTYIREVSALQWPGWLHGLAIFAIAGGLYLFMGYRLARWLNQAEAAKLDESRYT